MNDTAAGSDIEDCTGRLLAGMEKVEYLAEIISEKMRKQDGQKPECAILQREMCTHLDIMDDYIHEAINTINELREGLQYG